MRVSRTALLVSKILLKCVDFLVRKWFSLKQFRWTFHYKVSKSERGSPTFITIFISCSILQIRWKGKRRKEPQRMEGKGRRKKGGREGRKEFAHRKTIFHIFPANSGKSKSDFNITHARTIFYSISIGPTCYLLISLFLSHQQIWVPTVSYIQCQPWEIIVNLRDIVLPFLELTF